MGNCFSDPSSPSKGANKTSGQGQRLGSSATSSAPPPPQQPAANTAGGHQPQAVPSSTDTAGHSTTQPSQSPGRVLGDGFEDPHRGNDARSMAAAAAEERMKTANKRGVQGSGGKLSSKLESERKKPLVHTNPKEPLPMDARNYN